MGGGAAERCRALVDGGGKGYGIKPVKELVQSVSPNPGLQAPVKCDLNDVRKHAKLNRMNNVATVFVFFTVLINIFITALGFQGHTISSPASPVPSVPARPLCPLT
ncbi:ninjurin-2-like isoform X2 [Oreochromis aureus]|uniref:ninjurin-2-like isoform X2 n=1 Tax=Oreochromis aureus TaxID=47969 RepID=UPI001953315F|nr:ninjurin-2-like isoform X2 [Oreochromis aureus]